MHIDHVALYVEDLENMRAFYKTYFGAVANQKYHNQKTGLQTYFLHFATGARLEIMARPGVGQVQAATEYPAGYVHLAFTLGSKQAVDELTFLLAEDGYKVTSRPRTTGDGYYESCVEDPEGNLIELVA